MAALVIIGAGQWAALAIWFRLVPTSPWREILAGLLLLLAIVAIVGVVLWRWWVVFLFAACFAGVCGWWTTLVPSNDRAWAADVAHTASGSVEGDRLEVRDVRNFRWRSDTDFDPQWETRSYDLARLTTVDLVMSYWAGEAIAQANFETAAALNFSLNISAAVKPDGVGGGSCTRLRLPHFLHGVGPAGRPRRPVEHGLAEYRL